MLSGILSNFTTNSHIPVKPEECIASFVLRENEVIKSNISFNHIRYTRIMPRRNKKTKQLETSVCRTDTISDSELWTICSIYFDRPAPVPAIGSGTAKARVVYAERLEFDPNGIPYPQHANIIGWNDEQALPDDEKKNLWMDKAQRMAPHFKFRSRPSTA